MVGDEERRRGEDTARKVDRSKLDGVLQQAALRRQGVDGARQRQRDGVLREAREILRRAGLSLGEPPAGTP